VDALSPGFGQPRELLAEGAIGEVRVLHVATLKPIDVGSIVKAAEETGAL
jgi:transketolase C-terminal domain/subunit